MQINERRELESNVFPMSRTGPVNLKFENGRARNLENRSEGRATRPVNSIDTRAKKHGSH